MNPTLLNRYPRTKTWRGHLFALLAWLNWPRAARFLMRKPWHVATELRNGKRVPVIAFPTPLNPTMEEINKAAEHKASKMEKPEYKPKRTHIMSLRLKPGMQLWQLQNGVPVAVKLKADYKGRLTGDVDMRSPLVAALNAKNAERKLKSRKRS